MSFYKLIPLKIFLLLTSCASTTVYTRSQLLMGHVPVTISVKIASHEKALADQAMDQAYGVARNLERQLSEWQATSQISCLNQNAGRKSCKFFPDTLRVLKQAKELAEKLDGYFDIRFASKTKAGIVGEIILDEKNKSGKLTDPETQIGLGAIAKGYIVDQMLQQSELKKFTDVLISAGGDTASRGGPWPVAIQIPQQLPGKYTAPMFLKDQAIATSGNDEQPGHILSPKTMLRVERNQSVSVITNSLTLADAMATGFYVAGELTSVELLKRFPGTIMVWTDPTGKTRHYP
ncbi:MAG: FAD:protein FMN transferase [Deltaproteobacteria bacterium]|nr:FAD:protein FMN transferase [Deltaproteobacteria bacterium]